MHTYEKILQDIGEMSVSLWSEDPKGTFQSDKAIQFAKKIFGYQSEFISENAILKHENDTLRKQFAEDCKKLGDSYAWAGKLEDENAMLKQRISELEKTVVVWHDFKTDCPSRSGEYLSAYKYGRVIADEFEEETNTF